MKKMEDIHILIVDDEEQILELIKILISKRFKHVHTSTDGSLGLQVLNGNKEIECVLSDISMPKMNGIEFIKAARNQGHDIPFIFFTAYGNDSLMIEATNYGAYDFIEKPEFDKVEDAIVEAIENRYEEMAKENKANNQS